MTRLRKHPLRSLAGPTGSAAREATPGEKAPAARLPPFTALALALVLASTPLMPSRALAEEAKPACSGISHVVILGKDPVQVNPGAKCAMQMLVEVSRADQKTCINVREPGSQKTLGPFCTATLATQRIPGAIEWMWSADRPLRVHIILKPPRTLTRRK